MRTEVCKVFLIGWILAVPGFLWRHKLSVAVLVLVAPLMLTGSISQFGMNALAIGALAWIALKALKVK